VLNFERTLGGARIYVRDTVPPGDRVNSGDYDRYSGPLHWETDYKNSGPYARIADPGTHRLAVPPLRPGATYYLGVWSQTDTTFALSLTGEAPVVSLAGRLAFYGGLATGVLPPGAVAHYLIEAPADATRLKLYGTNAASVRYYLEQGTLATPGDRAHWSSSWANPQVNLALSPAGWPWRPGHAYYVAATNTGDTEQPFVLRVDGHNAATEDEDADGLPDAWEVAHFGSTWQYSGLSDPDADGVSNLDEFRNGTNPRVADLPMLEQSAALADGTFRFLFVGPLNGRYRAEYRTNLHLGAWQTLVTFTNVGGATWITDTNTAASGQRYYRAVPVRP